MSTVMLQLCKPIENVNKNDIFFCEPIKNTVIDDSVFIRIIYSNENMCVNGIYINFSINLTSIEKYYNKHKCNFNIQITENREILQKIFTLENEILNKMSVENKIKKYKIAEQMKLGFIKLFSNDLSITTEKTALNFALKISGVWENTTEYGLTYKFLKVNRQF